MFLKLCRCFFFSHFLLLLISLPSYIIGHYACLNMQSVSKNGDIVSVTLLMLRCRSLRLPASQWKTFSCSGYDDDKIVLHITLERISVSQDLLSHFSLLILPFSLFNDVPKISQTANTFGHFQLFVEGFHMERKRSILKTLLSVKFFLEMYIMLNTCHWSRLSFEEC